MPERAKSGEGDCRDQEADGDPALRRRRYSSSISPSISCLRATPDKVRVTLALRVSLPLSLPALTASRTAFSISRWEVTPTAFRNLRIDMFKRSSAIAAPPLTVQIPSHPPIAQTFPP